MRKRALWVSVSVASLLVAAIAPVLASKAEPEASPGPGCDTSRTAIAHHADGVALNPQPHGAPVPCGVTTGYPASETRIAVTNSGAVIYTPAILNVGPVYPPSVYFGPYGYAGIARTLDDGQKWSAICPAPQGTPCPDPGDLDNQLFMDRATGRFFWAFLTANTFGGGDALAWTDDDGATWGLTLSAWPFPATENPVMVSATPRTSTTTGYPRIVYFCGNTGIAGGAESVAGGRICGKSLDGGKTFIIVGQGTLFTRPVPTHPECGADTNESTGYPVAATDGTLYLLVSCNGKTYLARSTDEAATWPIIKTLPASLPLGLLRIDSADNLYLGWKTTGAKPIVNLAVSKDLGQTWTTVANVTAPGVNVGSPWYYDVGAPGQVAFSYYGNVANQSTFDGYLTYTRDGLDPNPVFWSARLNDPNQPLTYGPIVPGAPGGGIVTAALTSDPMDRVDYIGVAIGPDGTPWASFVRYCGPDPTAPGCLAKEPNHTTRTTDGFAGHFALPATPDRAVK